MPRVSLTRILAVPETSVGGWDFPVHPVPLSPCMFLKVVIRKKIVISLKVLNECVLGTAKALGSLFVLTPD